MLAVAAIDPDVRLRWAQAFDLPALSRLRTTSWKQAYTGIIPASWLRRMSPGRSLELLRPGLGKRGRLMVAQRGRTMLGYAWVGPQTDLRFGQRGEIYELYLDPAVQGMGIGRRLLVASIWELIRRRCNPVLVWVLEENPARFFYAHCGGVLVATAPVEVGGRKTRKLGFAWNDGLPLPLDPALPRR